MEWLKHNRSLFLLICWYKAIVSGWGYSPPRGDVNPGSFHLGTLPSSRPQPHCLFLPTGRRIENVEETWLLHAYEMCIMSAHTLQHGWVIWLPLAQGRLGNVQAYITLLCFTLLHFENIAFFTNWRFVAALHQKSLLAPFFQQHLPTLCLCVIFW